MKKNTIRISLLSIALVILGVFIFSKVNAASNVTVTLGISQGTVSCTNSTNGGALGSVNASYSAQTKTGTFTASSWTCTDNKGAARAGGYQVSSSALNGSAGYNIANTNVFMRVTAYSTTAGNITGTTSMSSWTAINSSTAVYSKGFATGVGIFVASPEMYVLIPANTPVGSYTGTITVTDAS